MAAQRRSGHASERRRGHGKKILERGNGNRQKDFRARRFADIFLPPNFLAEERERDAGVVS